MISQRHADGFSAVELLITLFIAAAFLLTGYQLYLAIIRDSGAAQQRTRASAIATDYLRRYSALVPASCASSQPLGSSSLSPTPEGLSRAVVRVNYDCPPSTVPSDITRVQVTVTYGYTSEEVVVHVAYAKRP